MTLPDLEQKRAFLSRPESYPDHPQQVETKETHMSCIFLTDAHAWKLKKPVRTEYLDFSTTEARRRNCVTEVRLNRRLAKDVYLGVVPLTVNPDGGLRLGPGGTVVDWLVQMRRLPAERMMDQVILRGAVTAQDVSNVASLLVGFYRKAAPLPMTGSLYRMRLARDLESARAELTRTVYGLRRDLVESAVRVQLEFLRQNPKVFDARVRDGRVIEAHGDLRPEHICLEHEPVIIDCLEFNRNLRILDTASELAFLALECERLNAPDVGEEALSAYAEKAADRAPRPLLSFYRAYHAYIRAKIAVWHLRDDDVRDPVSWTAKAEHYLSMAAGVSKAA